MLELNFNFKIKEIIKEESVAYKRTFCCSSEVLWKKACISFGIKLDAEKYNELKQYLKDIKKHEKLVSDFLNR